MVDFTIIVRCYFVKVIGCVLVIAAAVADFAAIVVRTVLAIVVDFVAATLSAERAGASKQGMIGAVVGTIAGLFTGLWGLVFMPLVGAAIGELIAHKDMFRAGKVGAATWFGMLIAIAVKLAVAFTMVGVFVAALLI